MSVPQYTTPTVLLTFDDDELDLRDATNVYVTFRSGRNLLTKTGSDLTINEKTISVWLSQEETSKFFVGDVEVQVNWTVSGSRVSSDVVSFKASKQLLQRVVE